MRPSPNRGKRFPVSTAEVLDVGAFKAIIGSMAEGKIVSLRRT
jgi:hypothetical protein